MPKNVCWQVAWGTPIGLAPLLAFQTGAEYSIWQFPSTAIQFSDKSPPHSLLMAEVQSLLQSGGAPSSEQK